ncbi:FmdE family protein [Corallococcus sp. bb12-1]|uniref:FmdE family protein n=1 Tax=Corallococcus sp. bb12-1 TaxID=2996784 RepID=UPI002270751F|nr:FmdE family protein [Corallococcus sp. bb12-1]MCY1043079.1 FmdE family protein [Corallococcus sp. bb12-1]
MFVRRHPLLFATLCFALGCAGSRPAASPPPAELGALERVALVHGGAGPWAVAGYRMGDFALRQLDLPRGSFKLEVVHHSPALVQYTCVADGAAAATGASLGKLNLSLVTTPTPEAVATTFRNRTTGQSLTLRPSASFVQRFKDVPREKLGEAGREVLTLSDADVFEAIAPGP